MNTSASTLAEIRLWPAAPAGLSKFMRYADWPLIAVMLVLLAIGLIAVWSFSPPHSNLFFRQLLWLLLGLGAFLVFSLLDYRLFRNHGFFLVILYLAMAVILSSLLFFAPITHGIRAWFRLGSAGIQPVEVMKLVLVLVLARYFSRQIGRAHV